MENIIEDLKTKLSNINDISSLNEVKAEVLGKKGSITERATVTYLVIEAIFFLPSSPSRRISSSFGMAIVNNCIIIEDVMYGVMFRAKTEAFRKEPEDSEK